MPTISVIVPVYNVEKYLQRCVDSILAQTFSDFELLLVDDGSPDNCGEICDWYATQDDRVHVIHQKNGGLSAARNAGIDWAFSNSDSQWLNFIDSDDWVHPQYLEVLKNAVDKDGTDLSITKLHRTDHYEKMFPQEYSSWTEAPENFYLKALKFADNMTACGKLYRKKMFAEIRFPRGRVWEDLATTYKILFQTEKCSIINEENYYYYYFYNEESITHARWKPTNLDEIAAYEEQLVFFGKDRKYRSILYTLQARYIKVIGIHVINLNRSDLSKDEKERYSKILKRKMQHAMVKYWKGAGVSYPEYSWELEIAFPIGMQVYWLTTAQIRKLKNLLGRK